MKSKRNLIIGIILIVIVFIILAFILFTHEDINLEAHCQKSVCNEDNTICYQYDLDANGKTKIIWRGNCSSLK